ncbi:hypothetical protein AA313_de0202107 [Arthrobotrys entomopaga]|nr:hypothetical protein AA313_de0202107 [Arthrobotrys entomopaga]
MLGTSNVIIPTIGLAYTQFPFIHSNRALCHASNHSYIKHWWSYPSNISNMIHEIPQESVRRLGATQVITDPITVIKELIENALDAGANSIIIEASPDLVSHLQIRDNGCGIDPSDRHLMAKPHCTSKMVTFDDLWDITTLGFRGEALASLAAVSGALTITTRVKAESMAVACKIGLDGSLKLITPVSAPVGCTVRVSNLFANFPVRKVALEKTTTKYLGQIRPLLLSYYLTHPKVRFQFKCVPGPHANQGKKKIDAKYDVIFAASNTREQAVMKAFGTESCRHSRWVDYTSEDGEIEFTAFVVNPDANAMRISKKGVCIAYKYRPLSVTRTRGLAQSIYSMYKKQVKAAFATSSTENPSEPLLYLNITSSAGKVDVNIEPAKDDILFESNEKVLSYIRDLFEEVYGPNKARPTSHSDEEERTQILDNNLLRRRMGEQDFSSETTDGSVVPSDMTIRQTPERDVTASVEIEDTRPTAQSRILRLSSSPPIKVSSSAINAESEPLGVCNARIGRNATLTTGDDNRNTQEEDSSTQVEDEEGIVSPKFREETSNKSGWNFNMFGTGIEDDDEDFIDVEEVLNQAQAQRTDMGKIHVIPSDLRIGLTKTEEDTRTDKSISNPWTISKMNARVPQLEIRTPRSQMLPVERSSQRNSPSSLQQHILRNTPKARTVNPQNTLMNSNVPIVQTPEARAPVPRMLESSTPYYPRFGSDESLSSSSRPRNQGTPRMRSNIEDTPPTSLGSQNRTRFMKTQKSNRRVMGPMDGWISSNQHDKNTEPESISDDDEGYTPPPSVFFGKPDLKMSSTPGDGGRGLFHSAADRIRRQRRPYEPDTNEEEDISSSSEEDIPISNASRGQTKVKPQSTSNSSQSVNRETLKFPYASGFFKATPKSLPPKGSVSNNYMSKDNDYFRPSSYTVLKVPKINLKSLYFRAQLVEDSFYAEDSASKPAPISQKELKRWFLKFLQRRISNISYGNNTELEMIRKNILDGKDFDVQFRNLADA